MASVTTRVVAVGPVRIHPHQSVVVITLPYTEVERRMAVVREIGRDVVENAWANRCAMAVSGALRIKPSSDDLDYSTSTDLKAQYKGSPMLRRYFLKARAAADAIQRTYGAPDAIFTKANANDLRKRPPGVVYLDNCWHTRREKVVNFLLKPAGDAIKPLAATGDHIDLWTGSALKIYEDDPNGFRLVKQSEFVWYWKLQ